MVRWPNIESQNCIATHLKVLNIANSAWSISTAWSKIIMLSFCFITHCWNSHCAMVSQPTVQLHYVHIPVSHGGKVSVPAKGRYDWLHIKSQAATSLWIVIYAVGLFANVSGRTASHLTAFYAWYSHLPVTPVQLMRPGIDRNTSCAVGDFA